MNNENENTNLCNFEGDTKHAKHVFLVLILEV